MRLWTLVLLLAIAALLAPTTATFAQNFKFYTEDSFDSKDGIVFQSDKFEHAIRDGFIFWGLGKAEVRNNWVRLGLTTGFATIWEIRDGFAWRKTDGFSFKDILAGMAGQVIVFGAEQLFDKPKPKKYDRALQRQLESDMRLYSEVNSPLVLTNSETILCLECKKENLKSSVFVGLTYSTLAFTASFYDSSGKRHDHNPNTFTTTYSCSNGHSWETKESVTCWCGWPNNGVER